MQRQQGYVLLVLLLMVTLLVIAAAAVAPAIAGQIRRDQEEELIHRGMQYRRAIRSYVRHTGNFPLTLEQLENFSGNRYLRKRYKDPITGGDFRLLHMNDIAALGSNNSSPLPGGNSNPAAANLSTASPPADTPVDQSAQPPAQAGSSAPQSAASPNSAAGGTTFGGGVIMGVASSSAKKTIREFNHKSRYNQWLFYYSAMFDGSIDVKGPTPSAPVFALQKSSPDPSGQNTSTPTPPSQPVPQSGAQQQSSEPQ
jgi:type II secretory pathway pseudopilin PulG